MGKRSDGWSEGWSICDSNRYADDLWYRSPGKWVDTISEAAVFADRNSVDRTIERVKAAEAGRPTARRMEVVATVMIAGKTEMAIKEWRVETLDPGTDRKRRFVVGAKNEGDVHRIVNLPHANKNLVILSIERDKDADPK